MQNATIKFDLIENAKDSLAHAVEHLTINREPHTGDYKRVILDMAHVCELILKERLRQVHPAFIWQNIDKYPSREAQTVTTDRAISRLKKFSGVIFSEVDEKTITKCRELRNSIEHYEFEITANEAKVIIGRILSFVFEFSKSHLSIDFESDFRSDQRWQDLLLMHDFWAAHGDATELRLQNDGKDVEYCPSCGANTYEVDKEQCALCEHLDCYLECDVCEMLYFENDLEVFEHTEGEFRMCQNCLSEDASAQQQLDEYRGK